MKSKALLRNFLTLVASSLLAMSSVSADTFTWTQTATGSQTWGTVGNWSGSNPFVSGSGNELMFFADITTTLPTGITQTIVSVPSALSMNTITLNGKGPNNTAGFNITIGDNTSTWTLGDGTTSVVNLNSALGGGTSDRDVRYIVAPNITLNQATTTFTGNSGSITGATFSGNITQAAADYGITKSGTSLLVLSGANSYTGTTLVSGGTLRLASTSALSGGIGVSGGTSALTINGGVVELGVTNFSRGLGTGSSQFQITGGTSGFSAFGDSRVVTVNNDASLELVWGSVNFAPTTLVLNAASANNSLKFSNKIDLNAATRTVQVNADKVLLSNDIRTSSGTAGLTKTNNGTLVLTGNNTYNGNTTINGGTLSVGTASNFGSGSSGLIMNAATLQIRGTSLTSISGLGHSVTFGNNLAKGFDIQDAANTFTVDQVLNQGTGTLTKSGVGTLVLNQNNTFTGATTVTGGGTLVLDYTTNNGSKLSDTTALTLNGSALVLKGGIGAGFNHTEIVGSTTLVAFTSSSISRDGGSSKISLGAITTPTVSSLAISEINLATTTTPNATGLANATSILALGRVTVGSHFGANDGSGNIVAYSDYANATTAGGSTTSTVNQLTGGGTMGATLNSYSLRIVNGGNSDSLNLDTGKNLTLINNGTLLYAGGFDNNYTINGSGTGAISSASGNQSFIINTYTGTTLTVNARTSSNFAPVQKAGEGTLVFGGNNATLGITYVQQGVLRVTHNDGLGPITNGTIVQGGAALELANNISIGAEALDLNGAGISNGGALRNKTGSNSYGGAISIGASGARINADASSSLVLTGGISTTLTQDVTFGGTGNTTVSTNAIRGSGSLIKDGDGTLTLSDANTYTGGTTVSAGTLLVNNTTDSGTGSNTVIVGANSTLGGTGTIGGATTVNGALKPGASPGVLSFANLLTLGATSTTTMEINGITRGSGYDGVNVGANLSLDGALVFDIGTVFGSSTTFDLFNTTGVTTGSFDMVSIQGAMGTGSFSFDSVDVWSFVDGGNSWTFTQSTGDLALTIIPEPSTALLGALGTLGLLALIRRRR